MRMGIYRMFDQPYSIENGAVRLTEEGRAWQKTLQSPAVLEDLRRTATFAPLEKYLYEVGFWEALEIVLGHPAVQKIMVENTAYHLIDKNPSAVEWGIFWLKYFQLDEGEPLQTINEGVEVLVDKLVEDLRGRSDMVALYDQSVVDSIEPSNGDVLVGALTTEGSRWEWLARHVVIAIPQEPLRHLGMNFPAEVQAALTRVLGIRLTKVFAVTETPPWWVDSLPEAQRFRRVVPSREVHYLPHGNDTVILIYTDEPETTYWSKFVGKDDHRRAEVNESPELKLELARVIRDIHGMWADSLLNDDSDEVRIGPRNPAWDIISTLFQQIIDERKLAREGSEVGYEDLAGIDQRMCAIAIIADMKKDRGGWLQNMVWASLKDYGIRDWGYYPFGAGVHFWRPEAKSGEVRELIKAFGFAGYGDRANLHIAGEAYSEYQGFIEGALSSAAEALETID
jgi:hypothetical protein